MEDAPVDRWPFYLALLHHPVKDRFGNEVNASGRPYREGMVFRCKPDGTDFEVLGHNFRNNYELALDSYGNCFQSDNDDDGNRGVRINYVMEFGNYGYTDEMTGANWGLYVHIPFCSSPCFYCGCTKVITRNHEKAEAYLYRLHREIELQGQLYDRDRVVEQLHFGGGTPTFLTSLEIDRLIEKLGSHFKLSRDPTREYSIELDPRTITRDTLRDLARIGFNRCSLGIQDFDPLVQEAVNRIQSVPDTLRLIRDAREFGNVGAHILRAEGAVEADRERARVAHRIPECLGRLSGQRPAGGIGDRDRNHDRPTPA